nr:MAG: spike protein [Ferret coronavirus]
MLLLLLLSSVLLVSATRDEFPCRLENVTIGSHSYLIDNFIKDYSRRLPENSNVVIGDFFPTVQPWYNCMLNTSANWGEVKVVLNHLKALYWDYGTVTAEVQDRYIVFAIYGSPYSAVAYFIKQPTSPKGGMICVCRGTPNLAEFNGVTNPKCWAEDCIKHHFYPCVNSTACGHQLYGFQWSPSELVAYLSGDVYRIKLDNDWHNRATVSNTGVATGNSRNIWWFNPVYNLTYYNVNKTTDNQTTIISNCTQGCSDYASNVFSVEAGGLIPDSFSFNNWFVLTNSSTINSGKFVSTQPLLVNCLQPVPSFSEAAQVFDFNTLPTACNGATVNSSVDVIRFNLNFTKSVVSATGANFISLNTTGGLVLHLSCFNESKTTSLSASEGTLPFGPHTGALYCYVSYNDTVFRFIGVLPPSVREFAISKWGGVYVNGYNYFQTFPIDSVSFNFTTGTSGAFWTIAYTSYTDVMLEVSDTSIKSVTYCNSHINDIKCSQLSADLPDGFYSVNPSNFVNVTKSFVTLPANFDHMYVNITGNVKLEVYGKVNLVASQSNVTLFNTTQVCVNTSQFTVTFKGLCSVLYGGRCTGAAESQILVGAGTCPFSFDKINQHMSFESICFSTVPTGDDCRFDVIARTRFGDFVSSHLYVSYKFGLDIIGLPAPDSGLKDLSDLYLDVCTEYNIYGHAGVGIIRATNRSLLGGLYYTSLSGDLLGFKNVTTGTVYSVVPCTLSVQAAVIGGKIVGAIASVNSSLLDLPHQIQTPTFYYHSVYNYSSASLYTEESMDKYLVNCTPVITYSNMGVCENGALVFINITQSEGVITPISTGNVTIPSNLTISVQVEYVQMTSELVSVDCAQYVCNGNPRCNKLLTQYVSACQTIEQALQMGARLESLELESMISISDNALSIASVEKFNSSEHLNPIYNEGDNTIGGIYMDGLMNVLPKAGCNKHGSCRSAIEDLLFNKVVTSGLGTVDEDYKRCTGGLDIADLVCAQYYNGIMVLPGVANADKLAMYTASLSGGITLGALGGGLVAIPFATAVQARLNYVALQTDVLQENQKILAASFNQAISNITKAFGQVNNAIQQTAKGLATVAQALTKVQDVVNSQGKALSQLTAQLQNNFQAISNSIEDIYFKLDEINADAQVDRLITGRLSALNAFVTQKLTQLNQVRISRQLANEKINECVKSQSSRYGFCGNGTHLWSLVNAAPQGVMFFHTVLLPTSYKTVTAWSGICIDGNGLIVKDVSLTLFENDKKYYLTPRTMYEPRVATSADFVRISGCEKTFVNVTTSELPNIIPDYIDVNKTIEDMLVKLNWTIPGFPLEIFNQTYLNLTIEISDLENRSATLNQTVLELEALIENINNTLVDLQWLNKIETYVKWPWWVWVIIGLILLIALPILLFCCLSTGCCGCCGCLTSCIAGCCKSSCKRPAYYEPIEKVHVN